MGRATKRVVSAAIAALATLVFMWLFGAFCFWDFNPGNWPEEGRFMAALIGAVLAVFAALIAGRSQ